MTERGDEFLRFFDRSVRTGQNRAALRAFFAQQRGQAAGVDVSDGDGFVAHQIVVQAFGGAEVAVQSLKLFNPSKNVSGVFNIRLSNMKFIHCHPIFFCFINKRNQLSYWRILHS